MERKRNAGRERRRMRFRDGTEGRSDYSTNLTQYTDRS